MLLFSGLAAAAALFLFNGQALNSGASGIWGAAPASAKSRQGGYGKFKSTIKFFLKRGLKKEKDIKKAFYQWSAGWKKKACKKARADVGKCNKWFKKLSKQLIAAHKEKKAGDKKKARSKKEKDKLKRELDEKLAAAERSKLKWESDQMERKRLMSLGRCPAGETPVVNKAGKVVLCAGLKCSLCSKDKDGRYTLESFKERGVHSSIKRKSAAQQLYESATKEAEKQKALLAQSEKEQQEKEYQEKLKSRSGPCYMLKSKECKKYRSMKSNKQLYSIVSKACKIVTCSHKLSSIRAYRSDYGIPYHMKMHYNALSKELIEAREKDDLKVTGGDKRLLKMRKQARSLYNMTKNILESNMLTNKENVSRGGPWGGGFKKYAKASSSALGELEVIWLAVKMAEASKKRSRMKAAYEKAVKDFKRLKRELDQRGKATSKLATRIGVAANKAEKVARFIQKAAIKGIGILVSAVKGRLAGCIAEGTVQGLADTIGEEGIIKGKMPKVKTIAKEVLRQVIFNCLDLAKRMPGVKGIFQILKGGLKAALKTLDKVLGKAVESKVREYWQTFRRKYLGTLKKLDFLFGKGFFKNLERFSDAAVPKFARHVLFKCVPEFPNLKGVFNCLTAGARQAAQVAAKKSAAGAVKGAVFEKVLGQLKGLLKASTLKQAWSSLKGLVTEALKATGQKGKGGGASSSVSTLVKLGKSFLKTFVKEARRNSCHKPGGQGLGKKILNALKCFGRSANSACGTEIKRLVKQVMQDPARGLKALKGVLPGFAWSQAMKLNRAAVQKIKSALNKASCGNVSGNLSCKEALKRAGSCFGKALSRLGGALKEAGKALGQTAKAGAKAMGRGAKVLGKVIKAGAKALGRGAKALGKAALKALKSVWKLLKSIRFKKGGGLKKLWNSLKALLRKLARALKEVRLPRLPRLKTDLSGLLKKVPCFDRLGSKATVRGVVKVLGCLARHVGQAVKTGAKALGKAVKTGAKALGKAARALAKALGKAGRTVKKVVEKQGYHAVRLALAAGVKLLADEVSKGRKELESLLARAKVRKVSRLLGQLIRAVEGAARKTFLNKALPGCPLKVKRDVRATLPKALRCILDAARKAVQRGLKTLPEAAKSAAVKGVQELLSEGIRKFTDARARVGLLNLLKKYKRVPGFGSLIRSLKKIGDAGARAFRKEGLRCPKKLKPKAIKKSIGAVFKCLKKVVGKALKLAKGAAKREGKKKKRKKKRNHQWQ